MHTDVTDPERHKAAMVLNTQDSALSEDVSEIEDPRNTSVEIPGVLKQMKA